MDQVEGLLGICRVYVGRCFEHLNFFVFRMLRLAGRWFGWLDDLAVDEEASIGCNLFALPFSLCERAAGSIHLLSGEERPIRWLELYVPDDAGQNEHSSHGFGLAQDVVRGMRQHPNLAVVLGVPFVNLVGQVDLEILVQVARAVVFLMDVLGLLFEL